MTRQRGALVIASLSLTVVLAACTHRHADGLAPVRPELFDRGGRVEPGAYGAAYSPGGTRLAVKSGQGIGAVTSGGKVQLVTPAGSHAVDFAWMPSGADLLVAEGPAPTGRLEVLMLDGTSRGNVPLDPVFSVGSGYGMAVAPGGRQAVAVAEDLTTLGGPERLSLVRIDLANGHVDRTNVNAVRGPSYVDADHVVLTALAAAANRVEVLTLSTGARRRISPADESADALGPVLDGRWIVYATESAVWAVPTGGGTRRRLAGLRTGAVAVAVDPAGSQAVVAERNGDVEQLRSLSLRALPTSEAAAVRQ